MKKESLPKTYRDLLKPEWKNKLGIEAEDFDWFAQVVHGLGEAEGLQLFREIVASNGISVRKGHTLLNNLVTAGEVPLGRLPSMASPPNRPSARARRSTGSLFPRWWPC